MPKGQYNKSKLPAEREVGISILFAKGRGQFEFLGIPRRPSAACDQNKDKRELVAIRMAKEMKKITR